MTANRGNPKSIRSRIAWAALALIAAWLACTGLLYAFQDKLVYFPRHASRGTPRDLGLAYEEVWLRAADQVRLHSWYIPADPSPAALLYCHGNGGNISFALDHLAFFNRLSLSVFVFDYRGYGESSGTPTEEGTYLDAEAALGFLMNTKKVPRERILIYGRSLGGAVATWLASRHPTAGLIVESSFTSVPDEGQDIFRLLPARLIAHYHYPTIEHLRKVRSPVMVIHAVDDPLIPFRHGQRLFAAAAEPKRFLATRGGHSNGFRVSEPGYAQALEAFVRDTVHPGAEKE